MQTTDTVQLNIWCASQCTIQLTWGKRQQLSATLPAPTLVFQKYEIWQQCYRHVYNHNPQRGRTLEEGIFPIAMDWGQALAESEQDLLQHFHQWLGGQALLAIRHKIQALATGTTNRHPGITLLIACNDPQMMRLPWETWDLSGPGIPTPLIRIGRTPITVPELPKPIASSTKYSRVLAILSEASDLNLQMDIKAIQSLSQVAELVIIQRETTENAQSFKQRLIRHITDDRGWELLIFAGHSDETELTGGRIHLAQDISLSMAELEPQLQQAQRQGLRAAIFNSCCGLSLAQSLIQVGLSQVVVMREPIPDPVAQVLLSQICQHLLAYRTLHGSVLDTCTHLKAEHLSFPSAHLVPSIFVHPHAHPYVFQRSLWKRWRQEWQPTRWEILALSSVVLLSSLVPVQDLLIETRTLMAAIYRDQIYERLFSPPSQSIPPIRLIAIDQDSINRALEQYENFQTYPMDRRYLAQIVSRLTTSNAQVVGIDYELYTQEPDNHTLNQVLRNGVDQQGMWFVLAANRQENKQVLAKTASPNWSLMGDIRFFPWFVRWPEEMSCSEHCPFAYSLAIAHYLKGQSKQGSPQPSLDHQPTLQASVSRYLQRHKEHSLVPARKAGNTLIDFSLPPNRVYEQVPAWRFLQAGEPGPQLRQMRQQQVVIIASGGYEEAEDNFSVPMALNYWCQSSQRQSHQQPNCPNTFTGGEAHAYMAHHLLKQHHIVLIPDWWMMVIATILGKWTLLSLGRWPQDQRQQLRRFFSTLPLLYGAFTLQFYISASIAIPWFWPAIIYWSYAMNAQRERNV